MIIYDPTITGSFQINGTSISSIGDIDNISQSVDVLSNASSSFSSRVSLVEGLVDSLNTASSSYLLNTTDTLDGDLTVTGKITAQEFHTEFVSASIIYESGSTKFGNSADDTHDFKGTLKLSGSMTYGGTGLTVLGQSTDGADNQAFFIAAGGAGSDTRGAYIWGRGNEATNGGTLQLNAGNVSTGNIDIYTGGNRRMFISSSGTVGVNTSTPLYTLDVNGTLRTPRLFADDGTVQSGFNGNSLVRLSRGDAPSYIQFVSPNDQQQAILFGDTDDGVMGSVRYDHSSDYMWFEVNNAERIRINSSGSVGIGTDTPENILHVVSTNNGGISSVRLENDGTSADTTINLIFTTKTSGGNKASSSIKSIAEDTAGNSSLTFSTPASGFSEEHLRIESTGRFLIGTQTSSSSKLKIFNSEDIAGISIENSNASYTSTGLLVNNTSSTAGQLFRLRSSAVNKFVVLGNGNVGIGTDSPDSNLHISTTFPEIRLQDNDYPATNHYSTIDSNGGSGILSLYADKGNAAANSSIDFYVDNSLSMRVDNGGYVGIGTTAPTAQFDVWRNDDLYGISLISSTNTSGVLSYTGLAPNKLKFYRNTVTGVNLEIQTSVKSGSSGGNIVFMPNNGEHTPTEKMRITSGGDVLIGTTSDFGGKLNITGNNISIATRGATSTNSGTWNMQRADTGAVAWRISSNQDNFFVADADFSHYAFLSQNPTAWAFGSDERLKQDIVDIDYGLDTILNIKPRRFTFKSSQKNAVGFIAQELRGIVPEAVTGQEKEILGTDTNEEIAKKILGVSSETLIPVLVKAIQELKDIADQQQIEIDNLKAQLNG